MYYKKITSKQNAKSVKKTPVRLSSTIERTTTFRKRNDIPDNIKLYVQKAISSSEETKKVNKTGNSFLQPYNTLSGAGNWYANCVLPVCPYGGFLNIAQGTGAGSRIGNKIKTKKLVFKYVITPNGYDATFNAFPQPMDVKLWFIFNKDDYQTIPSQTILTQFFQSGDTSIPPTGQLTDIMHSVNSDLFTVVASRTHKVGYQISSGTGNNPPAEYYSNNDYKYNSIGYVDLTKYFPKYLNFNDGSLYPNNRLIYVVVEALPASGATIATNQQPASMWYNIEYEYSDA